MRRQGRTLALAGGRGSARAADITEIINAGTSRLQNLIAVNAVRADDLGKHQLGGRTFGKRAIVTRPAAVKAAIAAKGDRHFCVCSHAY